MNFNHIEVVNSRVKSSSQEVRPDESMFVSDLDFISKEEVGSDACRGGPQSSVEITEGK